MRRDLAGANISGKEENPIEKFDGKLNGEKYYRTKKQIASLPIETFRIYF